jgi:hypothetical protein
MTIATGAIILWIVPVFVAYSMGKAKARDGLMYGLFLGWLGVLILALLPARPLGDTGTCPYCAEEVKLSASVCKHCRHALTPNPAGLPD